LPNLAVNAGPGTGKTYTACHLIRYVRAHDKDAFLKKIKYTEEQLAIWKWADEHIMPAIVDGSGQRRDAAILYAAYNNSSVEDVKPKIPMKTALHTVHGAGYKLLLNKYGYLPINRTRGMQLVSTLTGQPFNKLKDSFKWLSTLKFLEKCKEELLDCNKQNCQLLKEKYDNLVNMAVHDEIEQQANQLIPLMKKVDRAQGIEYIDQVWLAIWACTYPIYDIGIVDEAQDSSPARLALVQKLCKNLIFVGDPDQAINAFAGADPHSFDKIRAICDAELPLKISFRCPPNIILKANQHTPRAKLRGTDKLNGVEKQFYLSELAEHIKKATTREFQGESTHLTPFLKTHLIVCRYNAPLVDCCLKLWKGGVPASILGNQLVEHLCNLIDQRKAVDLDDLERKLDSYEDMCCRSAPEYLQEAIRDKISCIRLVIPHTDSIENIKTTLKSMFKVKKGEPHVTLSTIHKAKGTERDNIYILYPPIPSPRAITVDQKQQEHNLEFVAITRTLKNLYWIIKK